MNRLLSNEWIVFPTIAVCVFTLSYLWSDKIIRWLHAKSLGNRESVIKKLDMMFVEINHRKITLAMLALSFGFGTLIFFILWPNIILGLIAGSTITILGWSLPSFLVETLYQKRCQKFVDQMVDGMTIMANGIKSGLSVGQALERVVDGMKNPIRQEFSLVLSQMRLGLSLEESLNNLGDRIPKPDVQMFVTGINILKETGGNLAETFSTISETIRERQKVQKKIEALTTQGITQGVIITLVPFLLLIVFFLVDPGYVKPLVSTPMGIVFLLAMVLLQILGGIMIKKIVTINV